MITTNIHSDRYYTLNTSPMEEFLKKHPKSSLTKRDNIKYKLEILKCWKHQYRSALYNKKMFEYILSEVELLFLKCEKTKEFGGRSELLLDISILKIKLKKEITEAKF